LHVLLGTHACACACMFTCMFVCSLPVFNSRCQVSFSTMPTRVTAMEIAMASRAQPALPMREVLSRVVPSDFHGKVLDHGAGGGASVKRLALTHLIDDPKEKGKRRSVAPARKALAAMTELEIAEAASARGTYLGVCKPLQCPLPLAVGPSPHTHPYP